jgi:hypothetical protein
MHGNCPQGRHRGIPNQQYKLGVLFFSVVAYNQCQDLAQRYWPKRVMLIRAFLNNFILTRYSLPTIPWSANLRRPCQ